MVRRRVPSRRDAVRGPRPAKGRQVLRVPDRLGHTLLSDGVREPEVRDDAGRLVRKGRLAKDPSTGKVIDPGTRITFEGMSDRDILRTASLLAPSFSDFAERMAAPGVRDAPRRDAKTWGREARRARSATPDRGVKRMSRGQRTRARNILKSYLERGDVVRRNRLNLYGGGLSQRADPDADPWLKVPAIGVDGKPVLDAKGKPVLVEYSDLYDFMTRQKDPDDPNVNRFRKWSHFDVPVKDIDGKERNQRVAWVVLKVRTRPTSDHPNGRIVDLPVIRVPFVVTEFTDKRTGSKTLVEHPMGRARDVIKHYVETSAPGSPNHRYYSRMDFELHSQVPAARLRWSIGSGVRRR